MQQIAEIDPYAASPDPNACQGLNIELVCHLLGDDFVREMRDGKISQPFNDRVLMAMPRSIKCHHGIDMIEVRATPYPNLMILTFFRGFHLAGDVNKDFTKKYGADWRTKPSLVDQYLAECKTRLGRVAPERELGGLEVVAKRVGVIFPQLHDVLRDVAGLEAKLPKEGEKARSETLRHIYSCECEACKKTLTDHAKIRKAIPDIHPKLLKPRDEIEVKAAKLHEKIDALIKLAEECDKVIVDIKATHEGSELIH